MTNPAVLFDFDGTLVPNLDLKDMRRQIAAMAKAAGVPDSVYDGLYIVEIIEASQAWLSNQDNELASSAEAYAAACASIRVISARDEYHGPPVR